MTKNTYDLTTDALEEAGVSTGSAHKLAHALATQDIALETRIDAKFEKSITTTNTQFDKVGERFDKVDEQFDKISEKFSEIEEQFNKVEEQFSKIDERFSKVDQRFDKMDERFDKMDSRFDKMDSRFEEAEKRNAARFDVFMAEMKSMREDVTDLKINASKVDGKMQILVPVVLGTLAIVITIAISLLAK